MEQYSRNLSREFETTGEVQIEVDSRNGNLTLRKHDSSQVQIAVHARVRADSAQDAEREFQAILDGIRQDGDRITIRVPELARAEHFFFGRGSTVDYEVFTARATSASIKARNGRVEIGGIRGPVEIESRNGSVSVEGIEASVEIESRNGRVQASGCGGEVNVNGRNGSIDLEQIGGAASAETQNGSIVVRDVAGRLKLKSDNGSLRYTGAVAHDIDMEVGAGSIRVSVPADSRFVIDAESRLGSVRSDLPVQHESISDAPRPLVRLRSDAGSIRLESLRAGA